jgi:hypothetical protein
MDLKMEQTSSCLDRSAETNIIFVFLEEEFNSPMKRSKIGGLFGSVGDHWGCVMMAYLRSS